jgi:hypothetical protein
LKRWKALDGVRLSGWGQGYFHGGGLSGQDVMRFCLVVFLMGILAAGCGIIVPQLPDIEVVLVQSEITSDAQVSIRNTTNKPFTDLEFDCGFDTKPYGALSGQPDRLVTSDLSRSNRGMPIDYITATERGTFRKKITINTLSPGEKVLIKYLEKQPGTKIVRAVCVPSGRPNPAISIGGIFR